MLIYRALHMTEPSSGSGLIWKHSLNWSLQLAWPTWTHNRIRPVHILRIHKLRVSKSEFLGNSPMGLGIPPFSSKNVFESNPMKSRFLVRGFTVPLSGIPLSPPHPSLLSPSKAFTSKSEQQRGKNYAGLPPAFLARKAFSAVFPAPPSPWASTAGVRN